MNKKTYRYLIVSAAAMAFIAPALLTAAPPSSGASSPAPSASPRDDFAQRMQRLDQQLDSVFAKTFRDFGDPFRNSAFASSIDLREQKDKYVVRVYVPGPDTSKVSAKVEGDVLHVTASGENSSTDSRRSEHYEEAISLPGPVASEKMQIERKQNLVVITLPKAPGAVAAASPGPSASVAPNARSLDAFDDSIVQQMARMQGRMDQMLRDAFADEKDADGFGLTNGFQSMQLNAAVHVDDEKDQYVVHFNLPDKNLQDVNVQLENGQLRLTAAEAQKDQQQNMRSMQSGRYEQIMTLPGPVKEKGMKVERRNGTIVVTLPKA